MKRTQCSKCKKNSKMFDDSEIMSSGWTHWNIYIDGKSLEDERQHEIRIDLCPKCSNAVMVGNKTTIMNSFVTVIQSIKEISEIIVPIWERCYGDYE